MPRKILYITGLILMGGLVPFLCHAQLGKENTSPAQEQKIGILPGKILFWSNREDRKWRVLILKNNVINSIDSRDLDDPRWSPSGKKILCNNLGDNTIVIVDVATQEKKYVELPRSPQLSIRWGENENIIYYESWIGTGEQERHSIYRYDLKESKEEKILDLKERHRLYGLEYSPQANALLIDSAIMKVEGGIYLYKVGMSEPQLLVPWGQDPRWSPDGKKFVYSKHFSPKEFNEIYLYDMTTGESKRLTTNNWDDRDPCFSPDGTQICFSSFRHRQRVSGSELFVMNIDGSNERRITPVEDNPKYPNTFQRWSTDQYPDWAP